MAEVAAATQRGYVLEAFADELDRAPTLGELLEIVGTVAGPLRFAARVNDRPYRSRFDGGHGVRA